MTLIPQIVAVVGGAAEAFNTQYIPSIPGKSSNLTALLVDAPALVSQPVWYTVDNIRPFDIPVAAAVEFVGLIYLLILSVRFFQSSSVTCKLTWGVQFVVTTIHYGARTDATHIEDRLTFKWLIIIRIVNPVIIYFFVSVCPSNTSRHPFH